MIFKSEVKKIKMSKKNEKKIGKSEKLIKITNSA